MRFLSRLAIAAGIAIRLMAAPAHADGTLVLALDPSRHAEFATLADTFDGFAVPGKREVVVTLLGFSKKFEPPAKNRNEVKAALEDAAAVAARQQPSLSLPRSLAEIDRLLAGRTGQRRIVVLLADLDLAAPVDSKGRALSDGWLINPASPLVSEWLANPAAGLAGAEIAVLTTSAAPLSLRHLKESFFAKAFDKTGARLVYFGPSHATPAAATFARDVVAAVADNRLPAIALTPVAASPILQLIDPKGTLAWLDGTSNLR